MQVRLDEIIRTAVGLASLGESTSSFTDSSRNLDSNALKLHDLAGINSVPTIHSCDGSYNNVSDDYTNQSPDHTGDINAIIGNYEGESSRRGEIVEQSREPSLKKEIDSCQALPEDVRKALSSWYYENSLGHHLGPF